MRTHNLALVAAILLVFGGLFLAPSAFQKGMFIEEHAISIGNSLVATAQGADLDASLVTIQNGTFSSLNSPSDFGVEGVSISYPGGLAKALELLPIKQ